MSIPLPHNECTIYEDCKDYIIAMDNSNNQSICKDCLKYKLEFLEEIKYHIRRRKRRRRKRRNREW